MKNSNIMSKLKRAFSINVKDIIITIGLLIIAFVMCSFIRKMDEGDIAVAMIFILAVFLVSRYTEGYLYGIVASFVGVLGINYIFTYPYHEFNFTLAGYPITIISMLIVAIITSMLTTQIKKQEIIKYEAEREKTRSNLLRAISHDLRTPLTSIVGATSAIIDNHEKIGTEDKIKLLREVNEEAQWLIRMVENLLSITRIDNTRTAKIVKEQEVAEEVLAEAVRKFKQRFEGENVKVSVPEKFLLIPMDGVLIEQVIINLLENAVIHADGATEIVAKVIEEDNFAIFEVSDNGKGIPNEILPKIFEGSQQVNSEQSVDSKKNMGIGLSVCYTIIRAHGGNMIAENIETGGAVFRFYLPMEE